MPQFIQVIDFEKCQHYRDRKPPWIKLYRDLLSDDRLFELSEADRYQVIALFLLASQHENLIPNKSGWLKKELGINRPVSLKNLIDAGFIRLVEQDASMVLRESELLADSEQDGIPRARAERREEKSREETEKIKEPLLALGSGNRDEAADIFTEHYQRNLQGVPYGWQPGDFPGMAKLRKRLHIGTRETPDLWNEACLNYFASRRTKWTLQDLLSNFDVLRLSPLDDYGKPVNHSGASNNGHKTREQRNLEASRKVGALLGLDDIDSV